jgi:hypothetical protein
MPPNMPWEQYYSKQTRNLWTDMENRSYDPVATILRPFQPEQRYPIYDGEFLAIICRLRHWDYLLKGATHPVLVITDHTNLQFHQHAHKIGPCIAGYIAEREQYDIQLIYRPGASNQADALS